MVVTKYTIETKGIQISVQTDSDNKDFISLTDLAKYRDNEYPGYIIQNWLRRKTTISYIGLWEKLNNPNFNCLDFEVIEKEAGENGFVLTPKKWIKNTNAIGIISKQGRYASTFAHSDIAFKFASWISIEFELYLIKEFQKLKKDETHKLNLEWNAKREIAKFNYKIHTDAIKMHLISENLTPQQINYKYANEADILNVALFDMTSTDWRKQNPNLEGNIRDHTDVYHLIVLINLESMNAELIEQGKSQQERLIYLRKMARKQLEIAINNTTINRINKSIH